MKIEFYKKNTVPPFRLTQKEAEDLVVDAWGDIIEISTHEGSDLSDIDFISRDDLDVKIVPE